MTNTVYVNDFENISHLRDIVKTNDNPEITIYIDESSTVKETLLKTIEILKNEFPYKNFDISTVSLRDIFPIHELESKKTLENNIGEKIQVSQVKKSLHNKKSISL